MKDERLGPLENDRYKGYASDIFDGARHALSVIERLLNSHADAGEFTGTGTSKAAGTSGFAAVDLNAIAQSCASAAMPLAEKAGLRLISDLETELPALTADPTALRQIILNLLTNSLKFCPPGAEIRIHTMLAPNGAIALEVSDTGKGMTRRELSEALNPIRPQASRPNEHGGMGIGLPLVQSLVQANRGALDIESAPGRGTKVKITFPRRRLIAI